MLAIVDYGVGNLFSLQSSLSCIGQEAVISGDRDVLAAAHRIILPGVGAFRDAADSLRRRGLDTLLLERAAAGTPILGICLGMQMLFEASLEHGYTRGLGLITGTVRPIRAVASAQLKIPHIGWNALEFVGRPHPIFRHVQAGERVYFVHSYAGFDCAESCIAVTQYGAPLTAAVARGNVAGCQFHPEKSGPVGLNILRGFCEWGEGER